MKLYKFMKVDENGYIIDALENSYLFFQTPYLFDDPEDCDIKFNYNGDKSDWENFLETLPFSNRKEKRAALKLCHNNSLKWETVYPEYNGENHIKRKYKELGVSCLCSNKNSEKMWREYANNFNGVAFIFETQPYGNPPHECLRFIDEKRIFSNPYFSITDGHLPIFKVNYTDKDFVFNRLKDKDDALFKFLYTKKAIWADEEEYRLIVNSKLFYCGNEIENRKIRFDKSFLTGMIFGHNLESAFLSKLKSVFIDNYLPKKMQFYKTRIDQNRKIFIEETCF